MEEMYLDITDREGKRVYGTTVIVRDAGDNLLRVPIEKPESEPGGNMPMFSGTPMPAL